MNKKKTIICTVLFAVILLAVFIGSWFIVIADGSYRLSYVLTEAVTIVGIYGCVKSFYRWLMK